MGFFIDGIRVISCIAELTFFLFLKCVTIARVSWVIPSWALRSTRCLGQCQSLLLLSSEYSAVKPMIDPPAKDSSCSSLDRSDWRSRIDKTFYSMEHGCGVRSSYSVLSIRLHCRSIEAILAAYLHPEQNME